MNLSLQDNVVEKLTVPGSEAWSTDAGNRLQKLEISPADKQYLH